MKAIWGKGLGNEMNVMLAFVLDLTKTEECTMHMAAEICYKIYADGKFVCFGPQRAAHGYARINDYKFTAKRIVVEINSPHDKNFCWIQQQPFFACELKAENRTYSAADFSCYRLTDRVHKVQRYSYQRGFAEVYKLSEDRTAFYTGADAADSSVAIPVKTEEVALPVLLPSYCPEPEYNVHFPLSVIETGAVDIDENAPVWRDRAHTLIGKNLDGFKIEEWEDFPTDEASKFVYKPNGETGALKYKTLDFGRAITGFTELKVKAKSGGKIYFIFDEILNVEAGKGENYVNFERNTCSNVFKWTFEKGGEFDVSTFEPYTVRYACVVFTDGIEFECRIRDYENPDMKKLKVDCDDERVNKIVEAARNTLAQNSVDLLTDCPSRERAGWLGDSYFSSDAEYLFSGKNNAEKTLLENYALCDTTGMPKGIVPMCYPSDPIDTYIPNYDLWYIIEVEKYMRRYGKDELVMKSLDKIRGVLGYFETKENEFGLLENLEGWIFIEWSAANYDDHTCGVNIPSNVCYAAALEAAAKLFDEEKYIQKALNIKKYIKENAFNGEFFVDNLIRNKDGKLVQSGLITEVCQYYAFWFGTIDKKEYPELYFELMNNLGVKRKEGYRPEIETSNVIFGLYMRIDLLMREGKREDVLKECIDLFLSMAERTGTLWEHKQITASCDHGFASYAIKWILFALGKDVK